MRKYLCEHSPDRLSAESGCVEEFSKKAEIERMKIRIVDCTDSTEGTIENGISSESAKKGIRPSFSGDLNLGVVHVKITVVLRRAERYGRIPDPRHVDVSNAPLSLD